MDTVTTYSVLITFHDGRTYEKCGLSWFDALALKTHFLTSVPPAVMGVMTPEKKGKS
jgi:hypothetical protein